MDDSRHSGLRGLGAFGALILSCTAGLTGLSAQVVLPAGFGAQSGTGSTNIPFGRSTPVRVQYVYDASLFGGAPQVINAIDLRIEEGLTTAGKPVDLEILASSMGREVTRVQSTFAANRGVDETVVFQRKIFTLPPAGTAADPNPFDLAIPFDQSFTFDPATGGSLVLEFVVYGQPPGALVLDTTFVCDSPQAHFGPPACGPVGGPPLLSDSVTTQVTWGGSVTLRVANADPGATNGLMFGFQETGPFMGLDLPVDLSVIGATGCSLSIGVVTTTTAVADPSGTSLYTLFLPSAPELVGQWLKYQGIAFAPTANALGVVTSQPHKIQVCGWEPVARVFAGGTTATAGLRDIGVAAVLQLR